MKTASSIRLAAPICTLLGIVSNRATADGATPASGQTRHVAFATQSSSGSPPGAGDRPPAPILATCDASAVEDLGRELTEWTRRLSEAERAAYTAHFCDRAAVVCLDRFGETTLDSFPPRLTDGQSVQVVVLVPAFDRVPLTLSISTHGRSAAWTPPPVRPRNAPDLPAQTEMCDPVQTDLQALRDEAMPIAQLAASGVDALDVPLDSWQEAYWQQPSGPRIVAEWKQWAEAHRSDAPSFRALEVSYDAPPAERSLEIDITRGLRPETGGPIQRHYEIPIDHGRYHLEVAALVPLVVRGRRTVDLTPTTDGAGQSISIDQDWHVTAALMVQYFPFGRKRGIVTSFEGCRTPSCVENWLGIQVGAGLGDPFREWYMGLVFEPLSGLALGVGAALLQGQFLAPGMAEGMILPSAADLRTNTDYMLRPYFGLTLTTDILDAVSRATVSTRWLL